MAWNAVETIDGVSPFWFMVAMPCHAYLPSSSNNNYLVLFLFCDIYWYLLISQILVLLRTYAHVWLLWPSFSLRDALFPMLRRWVETHTTRIVCSWIPNKPKNGVDEQANICKSLHFGQSPIKNPFSKSCFIIYTCIYIYVYTYIYIFT